MTHFTPAEMRCRCGRSECDARQEVSEELLQKLERIRTHYGNPMRVASALRCAYWNTLSGGASNSEHLTGEAVDIVCETAQTRYALLTAGFQEFHRIGIGRLFLHFGCASNLPLHVVWLYGTP